jgi:hypothetical protein
MQFGILVFPGLSLCICFQTKVLLYEAASFTTDWTLKRKLTERAFKFSKLCRDYDTLIPTTSFVTGDEVKEQFNEALDYFNADKLALWDALATNAHWSGEFCLRMLSERSNEKDLIRQDSMMGNTSMTWTLWIFRMLLCEQYLRLPRLMLEWES